MSNWLMRASRVLWLLLGFGAASLSAAQTPAAGAVWTALQQAGVKDAEVALLAQPLEAGAPPLLAHNERAEVTLASTTKVITTLASLDALPRTFRWRTRAWLTGTPVDGRLQGDLILVGGGDATLNSARLTEWFRQLQRKGLRDIQGSIVLDQSLFRLSPQDHANTPVPDASHPHHAWPDALVVEDTRFDVKLRQDAHGVLAASFEPPLGRVTLVDQRSSGARCTAQLHFEPTAPNGPAGTPVIAATPMATALTALASAPTPAPAPAPEFTIGGTVLPAAAASAAAAAPVRPAGPPATTTPAAPPALARVVLTGQWSPRCPATLLLEAAPGRPLTAAVVAGAWNAAGGQLSGPVRHRDAPPAAPPTRRGARAPASPYPGAPWATLDSAPLPELVRAINKSSNNLMARNLLLSMAPGYSPTASTLQLARQRIGQWFQKFGLAAVPRIDNGSGLAHSERGNVLALVQLLQAAWNNPKVQQVFLTSLPVAGADGTLAGRFKDSPAQRNAFLKTGTLTGVRSLAGYVRARSGRMVAVAIVVNGDRAAAAVPALDRFIEWVVDNG